MLYKTQLLIFLLCLVMDSSSPSSTTSTPNSPAISTPNTPEITDDEALAKRKERRQLLNERQSQIIDLFQKCGIFPSAQDIDQFLVSDFDVILISTVYSSDLICSFTFICIPFANYRKNTVIYLVQRHFST